MTTDRINGAEGPNSRRKLNEKYPRVRYLLCSTCSAYRYFKVRVRKGRGRLVCEAGHE